MSNSYRHTEALMGTAVAFEVVGHDSSPSEVNERKQAVDRAVNWFRRVEESCTRFDPRSELMQLSGHVGEPVPVSALLFEAVQFALRVAEETDGAFDPTVGHRMAVLGFDREFRSGQPLPDAPASQSRVSFRDVELNPVSRTIKLLRPLALDMGAVVKGLAVDMAARELQAFENFAVDAGGDLYLGGCNAEGEPWSVGIRHPRNPTELIDRLHISDAAVCTSGDYERRTEREIGSHHILDPRTGESARDVASVTVVAPSAMVADVLATAAFVLGPVEGLKLLERNDVEGLIVTPELKRFETKGIRDE